MKLAIIGGRDFKDYKLAFEEFKKVHTKFGVTLILSGGATGADRMAEQIAEEYNIPTDIYIANWYDMSEPCKVKVNKSGEKYNVLAGFKRNTNIITGADLILAFWDGVSPGTKDGINKAIELKKKIKIIKY